MMNSKTLHNGFVLLESVMALTIIGFLLTSLLVLQAASFRRVTLNTIRVEHFYSAKQVMANIVVHPLKKGETRSETKEGKFEERAVYQQKDIPKNSVLARFKGLYQKSVKATWQQDGRERVQELIGYGFTPPAPEKQS